MTFQFKQRDIGPEVTATFGYNGHRIFYRQVSDDLRALEGLEPMEQVAAICRAVLAEVEVACQERPAALRVVAQ